MGITSFEAIVSANEVCSLEYSPVSLAVFSMFSNETLVSKTPGDDTVSGKMY